MQEIVRISVTDTVAEVLKKSIESGDFLPGEKLPPETKLCDDLKVSRTCIREAIRILQAMGYIEIRHGKGAYVLDRQSGLEPFSPHSATSLGFLPLMDIRNSVEVVTVKIAAEKANARQISTLESVHESFIDACKKHDVVRMIMTDELFHSKIAAATQYAFLISINKLIMEAYRFYRGSSFKNEKMYQNAVLPHGKILNYIREKNPEKAALAMQEHLAITRTDMETIINALPVPPSLPGQ